MRCDFQALTTGQKQHDRIGGEDEDVFDDGPGLRRGQEQQDSYKVSSLINENSQANCVHVCRYCKREFSSGRALGGHMRAHGSIGLVAANLDGVTAPEDTADKELTNVDNGGGSSSSRTQTNAARCTGCRDEERRSVDLHPKLKGSSRDTVSKWAEEGEAISTRPDTIFNLRNCCCVPGDNTDVLSNVDEKEGKKVHPLYALRRNPKRSRRFIDQDFTLEVIPPPPLAKKTSAMFLEKARACTECGKEFSSWKALFGHMRCHPEREWRGIQPPNNISQPESVHQHLNKKKKSMTGNFATFEGISELGSDDIGNCKVLDEESDNESIEAAYMNGGDQRNIYGWMTGKRSKRSRQAVRSLQAVIDHVPEYKGLTTPTDIREERDMAKCLVMLAFAGENKLETEKIDINRGATDEPIFNGSQWKESSAAAEEEGEKYGKEGEDETARRLDYRMTNDSRFVENYIEEGVILDRGGGGAEPRIRFRCSTCKRSFGSHQALGGHRASHKKVKGCFARTNTGAEEMVNGVEERPHATEFYHFLCYRSLEERKVMKSIYHQQGAIATARREEENEMNELMLGGSFRKAKSHQCSVCQRVFSTGQALGGHKRCHWGGGDKATSVAVFGQVIRTSSNLIHQSEQQQQHVLHHHRGPISAAAAAGDQVVSSLKDDQFLDLNLPAPAEEDEDFHSGMASVCSQKL